jgi:hypothetical protein
MVKNLDELNPTNKILLTQFHAVMTQNVVGRGDMKIHIRDNKMLQIGFAVKI